MSLAIAATSAGLARWRGWLFCAASAATRGVLELSLLDGFVVCGLLRAVFFAIGWMNVACCLMMPTLCFMFPQVVSTTGRAGIRHVLLRRAQPEDAQELYELVVAVTHDAPRTQAIGPDEVRDAAKQRTRIQEALANENALMLVAVDHSTAAHTTASNTHGTIIGELSAHPGTRRRLAHNLHVGMSVAQRARGQGVGFAMLHATLSWARTRPTLRIARLACVASNTAARKLYERCGFRVDGMQPGYFTFEDGTSEDDVIMSCVLHAPSQSVQESTSKS